jgi:hypothetical protein
LRYYFGGANNGTSLNWRITDSSGVATSRRIYANVGEWHNYVGTYDNSFVRVYKDGQLFDSIATSSGQIKTRPGSTIIGWSPDTSEYLDGRLSYVSIYNRGLSDEEILQNNNAIRERYQ